MRLSLILIQLIVFKRYYNFVFLSIVFNLFSFFLIIVFNDLELQVNRALIIAFINVFTLGSFYCDIFSSHENELKSYLLNPWIFKQVAISKFISLTVIILSVIITTILISNFFFGPITIYDIKIAVIFILSSLPVYLILGGMVSSLKLEIWKADLIPSKLIQKFLISTFAPIFFIVLQLWLKSILLYMLLFFSSCFLWFYIGLPYCVQKKLNKIF